MLCPPGRARQGGPKPFAALPLIVPTKTATNEAAGVVICWTTRGGALRVGGHVAALIRMYQDDGAPTGPLFAHGSESRGWTPTHALHKALWPALGELRSKGMGDVSETALSQSIHPEHVSTRGQQPRPRSWCGTVAMHRSRKMGGPMGAAGCARHWRAAMADLYDAAGTGRSKALGYQPGGLRIPSCDKRGLGEEDAGEHGKGGGGMNARTSTADGDNGDEKGRANARRRRSLAAGRPRRSHHPRPPVRWSQRPTRRETSHYQT
jgi:hypothetical protein